jgi:UDP-N-acetylglucosamine 1-carboxyvinyltransferase
LTDEECVRNNIPKFRDIDMMLKIFKALGVDSSSHTFKLQARSLSCESPEQFVKKMRISIYLTGVSLGRLHTIVIHKSEGHLIGKHSFDLHIPRFQYVGCEISEKDGIWMLDRKVFHRTTVCLSELHDSTMTGTANFIMAAITARGGIIIENNVIEPEIRDLCQYLIKMGAKRDGISTSALKIHGGALPWL